MNEGSLKTQTPEYQKNYLLVASLDNVKNIVQPLKAINFKEIASVLASDQGLKVTVEDEKCIQASAFIQTEVFGEYHLSEDQVAFRISLSTLLECLNIFGNSRTALKMKYQNYGSPLTLLLEDNGVITDCSIKTMDVEDLLNFNFSATNEMNKLILRSDCLKDIFFEMDPANELIEILLSPDPPYFRITTVGTSGETKIDIPRESDVIECFQCSTIAVSRYRYAHLKPSLKPLSVSQKVSIRTDERGLLCFQYMIKSDNHTCFVEYYCVPVVEDDDFER